MSKKNIIKNINKENQTAGKKEEKDNYFKFITTLTILLLTFVVTYMLIGIFYTKEIDFKNSNESKEDVSVDNTTIMLGQLFDQSEDEYYVLVYDMSDSKSIIPSWLSVYKGQENALTVYSVDSSKKFNSKYIVKSNSNKSANKLEDLKVISPTLLKIKDKSVVSYIEGEDDIINVFKQK